MHSSKNNNSSTVTKVFVLFFVCFCAVSQVFAQEADIVLSIEDAVSLAKQNNLSIKTSQNALKNLETKNKFSWNSISPTANISGSYTDDFENDSKSIGISGSVNIGLSTNLFTAINNAKLNYEKGSLTYDEAVRQVELSVRKAYYNILYEKENLELKKRSLETSRIQFQNNQEKFRNGIISELDAFTSQVNYESKKPDVESAEITLKNELASFKQMLGISQDKEISLTGSLDDVLKLKAVTRDSLPESDVPAPDVQSAEYDVKIAKNALLSDRFSAYAPSITGSYTYGKSKDLDGGDWSTTNRLSVGVTIPLDGYLPWSSKAVSIDGSKNDLDTAEKKLEDAKTTVAVKTENYLRKINQAISQLSSLQANVELAEKTYRMTLTAYNYGKTDLTSLQNANDAVLNAGVSLKSQANTLISSILDLEDLLGLKFGTLGK
ncbi:MAG: TolC family protein [Treponema sp.]|nr:TolC family protein [Treponema sp.]